MTTEINKTIEDQTHFCVKMFVTEWRTRFEVENGNTALHVVRTLFRAVRVKLLVYAVHYVCREPIKCQPIDRLEEQK